MTDLSCAPGDGPQPLVRLLNRAEAAFVTEFERRVGESPFCTLSLAHSRNVLRHLAAGPLRTSRLVELSDVSKQAISQQIVHLEREGYLTVEPDPTDARAHVLGLTAKGQEAQRLVVTTFRQIEEDWAVRLGTDDLEHVRRVLDTLVRAYPRTTPC